MLFETFFKKMWSCLQNWHFLKTFVTFMYVVRLFFLSNRYVLQRAALDSVI
jgi:hypothetical protein